MSSDPLGALHTRLYGLGRNHHWAPAIPSAHSYTSQSRNWDGFVLERHLLPPGEISRNTMREHCLSVPLSARPVQIEWQLEGRHLSGPMAPHRIYFRAAGDSMSCQWQAPLDAIYLSVDPGELDLIRDQARSRNRPPREIRSDLSGKTPLGLLNIVLQLDAHLREGRYGGLLFEQILLMQCGMQWMFAYAADPSPAQQQSFIDDLGGTGGLPARILAKLDDFILGNLTRELTVPLIAAEVSLSPFYLCRTFKKARQISLWQYVLICRIQLAIRIIKRYPDYPLAEIASLSGFESYSQFVAAFKKFMKMTPSRIRFHRALEIA
jgi:AraC-like DNA-binding protein